MTAKDAVTEVRRVPRNTERQKQVLARAARDLEASRQISGLSQKSPPSPRSWMEFTPEHQPKTCYPLFLLLQGHNSDIFHILYIIYPLRSPQTKMVAAPLHHSPLHHSPLHHSPLHHSRCRALLMMQILLQRKHETGTSCIRTNGLLSRFWEMDTLH